MKKNYTSEEANELINNNKKHCLILVRDKNDNFHFISSSSNWLCDAELLEKAMDLVTRRLTELEN